MNSEEMDIDVKGVTWDKPHFYLNGKIFVPKIYETHELGELLPKDYNTEGVAKLQFGAKSALLPSDSNSAQIAYLQPDMSICAEVEPKAKSSNLASKASFATPSTVSIHLDGKISADLNWKAAEEAAQHYCEEGLQLFWNVDLGLFDRLTSPLSNPTQFLSFMLSLEHLRDTLWKRFKDHTLGVCLYQGPANFLEQLCWDEQLHSSYFAWGQEFLGAKFDASNLYLKSLFARDAVAEYLACMANCMPDAMHLFLILEMDPLATLTMEAQLVNRQRFDRFHLIVKKGRLPTWLTYEKAKIGVCLPDYKVIDSLFYEGLEAVLENLLNKKIPFRIIPEAFLINEWDGLDTLIVMPESFSVQGKRKLQGFAAAGGRVVTLAESIPRAGTN